MSTTKMGFEGQIFYGAAGSTAATPILNSRDINYDIDHDDGDTTVRGDGTSVPIATGDPVLRKVNITWTMINDTTDTVLEALRTAAAAGTGVALRLRDNAAGKGFDGDVSIKFTHGEPLNGEQTYEFTATPSRGYGRIPQLYV